MSTLFPYNKIFKQPDPIPKYNYYVSFADLVYKKTFLNGAMTVSPIDLIKFFDLPDASIAVVGVTTPNPKVQYGDYNLAGTKSAGNIRSLDIDNLTIEFYMENLNICNHLYYTWLDLAVDLKTNTRKPMDEYEKDIYIFVHDRMGILIETRIYHGCFPAVLSDNKYDANQRTFLENGVLNLVVNNGMTLILA